MHETYKIPTKSPPAPMPRDDAAAATTAAISDMKAKGILSLEIIFCKERHATNSRSWPSLC